MPKILEISTSRKRTLATTFRGDARSIASLAMYYMDKGEPCKSLSELLRLSIEVLRDMIVARDQRYEVNDTTTAIAVLKRLGLFSTEDVRLNRATLLHELCLEDVVLGNKLPEATQMQVLKSLEDQCRPTVQTSLEQREAMKSAPSTVVEDKEGE